MSDYSLELSAERIDNPHTKMYFREVISSYHAENYRSSVVMLWSVIICDLIYKLQHLRDVDNDQVAERILREVEGKQKIAPNNPDWETFLLDKVKNETELLDSADHLNLNSILKIRHLSAHPVLDNVDLLFTPYREQVRGFIRVALEALLTKPPVFLRQVVNEFVVDLASKKDLLVDDASLRRYIESKYLRRLRPTTENHLFKALWKFVFILENEDTNENREINFRCLNILYSRRPDEIKGLIRGDRGYFERLGGNDTLKYMVRFLSDNPAVYPELSEAIRVQLDNYAKSSIRNFAISFFVTESIEEHLKELSKKIDGANRIASDSNDEIDAIAWRKLLQIGRESNNESVVKHIAISMYGKSASFATADTYFKRYIRPTMARFNETETIQFISVCEENAQTHRRSRASTDHREFLEQCSINLSPEFEKKKYPEFFRWIGELEYDNDGDDEIPF